MKAHPYRGWILVAALSAIVIGFLLYRYLDIKLLRVYLLTINIVTFLSFGTTKRLPEGREPAGFPT